MSLQFVFGSAGTGKTHTMYTNMINESLEDTSVNYIVLVPEQFTMEAQRKMVSLHPNKGVMYIDILSFDRLALRIFSELGQDDINLIDDTAKSLIIRKVLEEHKSELKIYSKKITMNGFVENMKSAISQFQQYGIGVGEIEQMISATKDRAMLNGKLNDIKVTYEAFLEMINNKFVTNEEILDKLSQLISESELIKNSKIYIDGFTGFTPIQYKLLAEIIHYAKKVTIALTLPQNQVSFNSIKEQELFCLSKKTIQKLGEIADRNNVKIEPPVVLAENEHSRLSMNEPLKFLEQNIFKYDTVQKYAGKNNSISIHMCSNPKEESQYVACTIADMVINQNMRYKDFAVITADMEGYYRYIDRAFKIYSIPNFIDHKRSISGNPFINSIKSAIEVVEQNYSYESIFNFLRFGMTDISNDEIDRLENYVIRSGIRGKNVWMNTFEILYRDMTEDELLKINETREKVAEIFNELTVVLKQRNADVEQYTLAIYDFIINNNLYSKLKEFEHKFRENGDTTKAEEYAKAYDAAIKLFDKIVRLFGKENISLKEYKEIISSGLDSIKVGVIPPTIDKVVVGDMERTRLDNIKVLFFVGVNDGIIPKSGSTCDIITDYDKEVLAKSMFELAPTTREKAFIERFYLYMALTKPSEKLFLSYSKSTASGETKTKSYLINVVSNLFTNIEIVDEEQNTDIANKIVSYDTAITQLAINGREYIEGDRKSTWNELYDMCLLESDCHGKAVNIADAMFYEETEEKLTKEIAEDLYGKGNDIGITRLEKYARCAYMQFLESGLGLKEKKVHQIAAVDMGNLYHDALDRFCHKMHAEGIKWQQLDDNHRESFVKECVEQVVSEYDNRAFLSSARSRYLVKRIEQMTDKTVWVLSKHLKAGKFEPAYYELKVASGRVDRVDLYETDAMVYVKVIDYKSGHKEFSLIDTYYGLQLQLVAYMKDVLALEKKEHPDKKVVPAGVFYYNIKDPYMNYEDIIGSVIDEESVREAQLSKFVMSGIINDEYHIPAMIDDNLLDELGSSDIIPIKRTKRGMRKTSSPLVNEKGFEDIIEYVDKKRKMMVEEIKDGHIEINPCDKNPPCEYCRFESICGFHSKENAKYRELKKIDNDTIWREIKHGGKMD